LEPPNLFGPDLTLIPMIDTCNFQYVSGDENNDDLLQNNAFPGGETWVLACTVQVATATFQDRFSYLLTDGNLTTRIPTVTTFIPDVFPPRLCQVPEDLTLICELAPPPAEVKAYDLCPPSHPNAGAPWWTGSCPAVPTNRQVFECEVGEFLQPGYDVTSLLDYDVRFERDSDGNVVKEIRCWTGFDRCRNWTQACQVITYECDCDFREYDFTIHLTEREPFYWNTSRPYNRQNEKGVFTQIRAFNDLQGFAFMWVVNNPFDRMEIDYDHLRGNAMVFDGTKAFQYNGIPHQALTINPDGQLVLDGTEYCRVPRDLAIEGFAAMELNGQEVGGKIVFCTLPSRIVPTASNPVDINIDVWNQNEATQSRKLDLNRFGRYDLTGELGLHMSQIFTPKWQLLTTSAYPVWAVFYQYWGTQRWGGNVWKLDARDGLQCKVSEPGSLIVFPLIDNIGEETVIELINGGDQDVYVMGYMVVSQCEDGMLP
jgi:hypothetical protein